MTPGPSVAILVAAKRTRGANVMGEISKVAVQLHEFIKAADKKSKQPPLQNYKQYAPAERPLDPILKIYEECLSKLTPDELAQLDGIIKKMSGAV
jgi:hypothetical protein